MRIKVKIYDNKTKIGYKDDLPKVVAYFKGKIDCDIEFSEINKTPYKLNEAIVNIYSPNDNQKQDVLMYIFDRAQRSNSYCLNFSKTLQVIEVSTSKEDDGVDYTWKLICHELVHTFFHRLQNTGVTIYDCMDLTFANGVWNPYYRNEELNAVDGNFAQAFKTLAPYLYLLDNTYIMPKVVISRKIDDEVQTTGELKVFGAVHGFACKTLERPWKNNQRKISCIPKGTYLVKWTHSIKFPLGSYEVQKVANRDGIRFHKGNYFFDVDGCILLGSNFVDINNDGRLDVVTSRVTTDAFNTLLDKKDFTLEIV